MDNAVKIDYDAIANWFYTMKDFAIKSQQKCQKTLSRLEWAVTLQEATRTFVNEMEPQVNELLEAFQILATGRVPPR